MSFKRGGTLESNGSITGAVEFDFFSEIGMPRGTFAAYPASAREVGDILFETSEGARFKVVEEDGEKLYIEIDTDTVVPVVELASAAVGSAADSVDVAFATPLRPLIKLQPFGTLTAELEDKTAELQAIADALETAGGGPLVLPPGALALSDTLEIPDSVQLIAAVRGRTRIHVLNIAENVPAINNKTYSSSTGDLGSPGIVIEGIAFTSERVFPDWLSNSAGNPIADPEADYRAGGVLAPTTVATLTATLTDGAITSVTITDGGSGYVYPPTAWITGDGEFAQIDLTISGGAVTAATIRHGGSGYTTATVEVAGGGADPATALVAADRRNADFNFRAPLISLTKALSPKVRHCDFSDYGGNVILDRGCDGLIVEYNTFTDVGQSDFVGNCLWSQSHGSAGDAFYRASTDTVFRFNTVSAAKRSVALVAGNGFTAHDNIIHGWGESCFFIPDIARNVRIHDNYASGGRITDIVCAFVEAGITPNIMMYDNTIIDCDAHVATLRGDGCIARGNMITAGERVQSTYPFAPYSERYAFNSGEAVIAGTNRPQHNFASTFLIMDIDNAPENAPSAVQVQGNTLVDPDGRYEHFLSFSGGASNSIGEVLLCENDITQAPSTPLFDIERADNFLDENKHFRCVNNPGHVSMGAVQITRTISANTLGHQFFEFGFRPRTVHVLARKNAGGEIANAFAMFVDEASKNPGDTGGGNTSGSVFGLSDSGASAGSTKNFNYGAIKISDSTGIIFNSNAIGFSASGWTINVLQCDNSVDFIVMGTP